MALLSVDEFLARVDVVLPDDAIQGLLDDADDAITARAGAIGASEERLTWGGSVLILGRRASAITSIETVTLNASTELDPDDYRLGGDGRSITRLATGPTPSDYWVPDSIVTFTAYDDEATRRTVQQKLVELDIAMKPGLSGQTVGSHSIQLQQGQTYPELREEILSLLGPGWRFA